MLDENDIMFACPLQNQLEIRSHHVRVPKSLLDSVR